MRKKIAIFGSTGSVGTQVLQCLRFLENEYEVVALTCNSSKKLFEEQKREWKPKYSVVASECENPQKELSDLVRCHEVEYVVNALSGACGVSLTQETIDCGKTLFLANKESLVMKGEQFLKKAKVIGGTIVPLDSEAAGLWQLLRCESAAACTHREVKSVVPNVCPDKMRRLQSVTITASGGPFFGYSPEQLAGVTREHALTHPTWKMGQKITVDSATLVNKAFEVIECARLFSLSEDKINVLVDRKSFVHASVEYANGEKKWVVYPPDMRTPIFDALLFVAGGVSTKQYTPQLPRIVDSLNSIQFSKVDESVFFAIRNARSLIPKGDTQCADFCAKSEREVSAFINGEIPFTSLINSQSSYLTKQ